MRQTRGDKNAHWIEMFCLVPRGPDKGERVVLTQAQRETVRMIYDNPSGPQDVRVTGSLAAYLALLHICGPEALQHDFRPDVTPDIFTVWGSVGPDLRPVVRRDGEHIVCPDERRIKAVANRLLALIGQETTLIH